jgi:resuscitation-promoting factor RpfB
MKPAACLALVCGVAVGACAAPRAPSLVVLEGNNHPVAIQAATVQQALTDAGVRLQQGDEVLFNGQRVGSSDRVGGAKSGILQVRHGLQISVDGKPLVTSAETVGEALAESGYELYAADVLDPPAAAHLWAGMTVSYLPSATHTVSVDGTSYDIRAAAPSVAESLAQAGFALVGLDGSNPSQSMPKTSAEPIRLARVAETLTLETESIPFSTDYKDAADVGLGQERIVQAGSPGLRLSRTKVRYEDGSVVSRSTGPQTVIRPAQARVIERGTKVVEQTANINGANISYWLKTEMYATVYSPCDSDTGGAAKCSYGTASGLRAGKGVVAVDPTLYAALNGQRLFITGYGFAVIGDLGGGYIFEGSTGISRYKWIDLGFDDGNVEDMSGWITVYFLAPAPATIPSVLK